MINLLLITREITSHLPRVKGLGIIVALIVRSFRRDDLCDVEVSVFGRKMLLKPSDSIGHCLIFTPQWYDYRERRFIAQILNKGDYIIDVGANVGAYTLMFADIVGPSGKVTAVEAEQENAKRLRHNIDINNMQWAQVHNLGVSDKKEVLSLLLNSTGNAGGHSFYMPSDRAERVQIVECCPLSELVDDHKIPKFMKLDIEGFEWRVLRKYFEDVPDSLWPQFIMLEDCPAHREGDAVALVLSQGYRLIMQVDTNVFFGR